ncbi:MAG: uroporphyrinogen decarboxylase family protein [Anaerolineae bacterium]
MDHRERVLLALHHEEPDCVPTALWGSAYGLTDPLYFALVEYLGLGAPLPPFRRRKGHSVNYYDDRVLEALDVDVRHVWLGFTDLAGPPAEGGLDAWGVRWERKGLYLTAVGHPLREATEDDLERHPWPDPEHLVRLDEARERARFLKEKTDFAVVGRAVDSYGFLERACLLRGTEQFLMDLALNPGFAQALIGKIATVFQRLHALYLDAVGPYLDVLELPGDDYAAQTPLISPRMFEAFFKDRWKDLIDQVKAAAPQCKVLFHSDGHVEAFLDHLADVGVDAFHCLEPLPGVDMARVKREFGHRLCFWGAVDIKEALQGDIGRVRAEVRERVRTLAPGGGYVLAPANHLQPDIPPENVAALFAAARQYGRYPIQEVPDPS